MRSGDLLVYIYIIMLRMPQVSDICNTKERIWKIIAALAWRGWVMYNHHRNDFAPELSGLRQGDRTMSHTREIPSMDAWLKEAKAHPSAERIGMYLTHNGVVRATGKALVRQGAESAAPVSGMEFSYDREKAAEVVADTYRMDGIYYIKTWLNEGTLRVGDDIMYVLIGGDIRPHVVDALQYLVGRLKNECVRETELN